MESISMFGYCLLGGSFYFRFSICSGSPITSRVPRLLLLSGSSIFSSLGTSFAWCWERGVLYVLVYSDWVSCYMMMCHYMMRVSVVWCIWLRCSMRCGECCFLHVWVSGWGLLMGGVEFGGVVKTKVVRGGTGFVWGVRGFAPTVIQSEGLGLLGKW